MSVWFVEVKLSIFDQNEPHDRVALIGPGWVMRGGNTIYVKSYYSIVDWVMSVLFGVVRSEKRNVYLTRGVQVHWIFDKPFHVHSVSTSVQSRDLQGGGCHIPFMACFCLVKCIMIIIDKAEHSTAVVGSDNKINQYYILASPTETICSKRIKNKVCGCIKVEMCV